MTTDYCFICKKAYDIEEMYPLLFAVDETKEN